MRNFIFFILSVFTLFNLFSLGKKENTQCFSVENTMKILGRTQIYGNEPHTFVGIIDENGTEYAVYPPSQEEKLKTLQGHLIEFTVVLLDEPKGDGSIFLKGGTVTVVKWELVQ